jgi:hypothetical protein
MEFSNTSSCGCCAGYRKTKRRRSQWHLQREGQGSGETHVGGCLALCDMGLRQEGFQATYRSRTKRA